MADDLRARAHANRRDIIGSDAMLIAQRAHRLDRRVRRHVTRVALDAQLAGFPSLAQARGEQGGIGFRAIGLEESEASFEDGVGTFEARLREARREDPGLGGAAKVQALY